MVYYINVAYKFFESEADNVYNIKLKCQKNHVITGSVRAACVFRKIRKPD